MVSSGVIYIIGDSHVSVFSGTDKTHEGLRHIQPEFGSCYTLSKGSLRPHNKFEQRIPYFCPIKVGSYTAYNSYNKLAIIEQVINEYGIGEGDYLFTCFGEIDIRNHIGVNTDKNGNGVEDGIELCVDRYMKTVLSLKSKGLNVGVYGPPASSNGWVSTFGYKDCTYRNKMTLKFNEYLKVKCVENDLIFKDISKVMILPDGTTNEKYIMDDIHLSQEIIPFIKLEFKDIIDKIISNE